ncbi:hypothetical protein Tco_0243184 [Tanacetum coccineum]
MPTERELALEQTQQGVSYEVSVSIEGVKMNKENHGPSDAMHNPSQLLQKVKRLWFPKLTEIHSFLYDFLTPMFKSPSHKPCDLPEHQSEIIHNEEEIQLRVNIKQAQGRLCKMVMEVPIPAGSQDP